MIASNGFIIPHHGFIARDGSRCRPLAASEPPATACIRAQEHERAARNARAPALRPSAAGSPRAGRAPPNTLSTEQTPENSGAVRASPPVARGPDPDAVLPTALDRTRAISWPAASAFPGRRKDRLAVLPGLARGQQ